MSYLQVLCINLKNIKSKTPPFAERTIHEAHCVVLNEQGAPVLVGMWSLPDALKSLVTAGSVYRPVFDIAVSTFGDDAGRIAARIVSVDAVAPAQLRKLQEASRGLPSVAAPGAPSAAAPV